MSFDTKHIIQIAQLACIDLPKNQHEKIKNDLNELIPIINKILKIDTKHIKPITHPLSPNYEIHLSLREDIIIEDDSKYKNKLNENAPLINEDGLFIVPKIIE